MKQQHFKALLAAALVLVPFLSMAQNLCPPPPPEAPLTGGLGILAIAGISYGVKKFRNASKSNTIKNK
jgi:hypothetical protein